MRKKDRESSSMKDAINSFLKASGLEDEFVEKKVLGNWESIVGKPKFKELIKYTNREMKLISITYNHTVMIITDNFEWIHSKFTKSQLTDIMSQEISIITHHQYKNSCSGAGSSTDPL